MEFVGILLILLKGQFPKNKFINFLTVTLFYTCMTDFLPGGKIVRQNDSLSH